MPALSQDSWIRELRHFEVQLSTCTLVEYTINSLVWPTLKIRKSIRKLQMNRVTKQWEKSVLFSLWNSGVHRNKKWDTLLQFSAHWMAVHIVMYALVPRTVTFWRLNRCFVLACLLSISEMVTASRVYVIIVTT